jgi:hypothetical protein
MYYLLVLFSMVILPICSIVINYIMNNSPNIILLIMEWFVFWAIGIRLLTAGLRQIFQPKFTAQEILQINDPNSWVLVKELGFSNIAIGILGISSLMINEWILPAAVAGGVFLGMAGVNHLSQPNKNRREKTAMISNLFVFAVLLLSVVLMILK